MARVDYYQIESDIRDHLLADSNLDNVVVQIESDLAIQRGNNVVIYLNRRDGPDRLQTISAGTRTRYELELSIWCYHVGGLETRALLEARDDLLGRVEIALLSNRSSLESDIGPYWIRGGEFQTNELEQNAGFVAGAEIEMFVQATAVA